MGRGLIRYHIWGYPSQSQFGVNIGRVADQANGFRRLIVQRLLHQGHRLLQGIHHDIHVTDLFPSVGARRIYFYDEPDACVHRDCQRLCPPHSAQSGRQNEFPSQRRPSPLARQ